jgi:hypothetical protein
MNEMHSHASPTLPGQGPSTMIMVGGGMGIAGAFLGLIIFLTACFGLDGAFLFSPLPFLLGAIGLVVCIVGAVIGKGNVEDTQILGVMFVCLFGIVGGLLEMSVRFGWHILGS